MPVREGYGQTENTALATFTPADDVRIAKVGVALPGVELAFADDGRSSLGQRRTSSAT